MRENLKTAPIIGKSMNLKEIIKFQSKIKNQNENNLNSLDKKQL